MPRGHEPAVSDLYMSLDVETRIVVQQRTSEIKTLMRRTAQDIIEIGQKLIEVKSRLGHGLFGGWLQSEFEWSERTAQNYMNVADVFKSATVADLIPSRALYLLAAPSTPESARDEILERAGQGQRITHSVAQEIVAAHRVPPVSVTTEQAAEREDVNGGSSRLPMQKPVAGSERDFWAETSARERTRSVVPAVGATPRASAEANHKMAVHFSSRTAEHYTPEIIIASTLACLGEIDLDPCSDGGDPPNVPAHTHYTAADDGLAHVWHGRIYMNPPYGREIGDWVEKLCSEHEAGRVTEAIALLPSRTDTQWWKRLREYPVCFVEGRLTFVGSQDSAPFPSAVFYLGRDVARFCRAFSHLGDIYQRIEIEEQQ